MVVDRYYGAIDALAKRLQWDQGRRRRHSYDEYDIDDFHFDYDESSIW